MKKLVLTLDLHDNKDKQRAMKKVSSLPGIDSIAMDMNTRKLTVIGTVDPVDIVSKLRKLWRTDIVSIGPAKEPEKKEEPKKEEAKKDEPKKEEDKKEENKKEVGKEKGKKEEPKKEEAKKEGEPKKEETKKEEPKKEEKKFDQNQQIAELVNAYRAYNPHMVSHYYVQSAEENPNACVIC